MIFRVLGCSGSESDRNHPCSFLVNGTIAVDMGSTASRLTIEEQSRITDIFVSHAHLDHTKDLAFFSENIFTRVKRAVTVRGTADTLRKLQEHLLNNELWPDFTILPTRADAILKFEPFEVGKPIQMGDLTVHTVDVNHPGGCVGLFFESKDGCVLYSGDTGPTEKIWVEVNRFGSKIKAVLLEASFPSRLDKLAEISGHLTPETLAREIQKFSEVKAPIYVYHLKAPYRDETIKELMAINDARVRILEPGMEITF